MSRSIHSFKLSRRRKWRKNAFAILGKRDLNDISKGDRSNTLRNLLKSKSKNV